MSDQKLGKLNQLLSWLPDDGVVDAATLEMKGYTSNLRHKYVAANWLASPVRGVFVRPGAELTWESVVFSLQTLMGKDILVVGRTALELKGYSHYLELSGPRRIRLGVDESLPGWLKTLPLEDVQFESRRPDRLFGADNIKAVLSDRSHILKFNAPSLDVEPYDWGRAGRPLFISTLERSVLELLETVPSDETFHRADRVFEGLTSIRPRRMQSLLERCESVKTKRLFFFFARRHQHYWLKHLDEATINLGTGKRSIAKDGVLDGRYQITVPAELVSRG